MTDQTAAEWDYYEILDCERGRLGDDGAYLNFVIRERGKLGALAFVCSEEVAQQIVGDHNEQ